MRLAQTQDESKSGQFAFAQVSGMPTKEVAGFRMGRRMITSSGEDIFQD